MFNNYFTYFCSVLYGMKKEKDMNKLFRTISLVAVFCLAINGAIAQSAVDGSNTITTAVPFLNITPDSRAGGMGDLGVATLADANSQHWNPAKYGFLESESGFAISYTPWLSKLVSDMNVAYLSGYWKLDKLQTLSASLRYFSLGDIIFRNDANDPGLSVSPNEFAVDFAYSRRLSDSFSGAVAVRYIRSDIFGGQDVDGVPTQAGSSVAADVAFYYNNSFGDGNIFTSGINISNVGMKISYDDENKYFLPTNMRLGFGYTKELDKYNRFSITTEFNKLLVPIGVKAVPGEDGSGEVIIADPEYSDKSVLSGIFDSFSDAPGGFSEELKEITWSVGGEYVYNNAFALRAGYFHESEEKGNRQYFTAGAGVMLNLFTLDFSYLFTTQSNHPLENTLRFSLSFSLDQILGKTKKRGIRLN